MNDIVWYYDPDKNPDGASFIGVPLRDLTEADMQEIPSHSLAAIEQADFYRKTKPKSRKPEASVEPPKEG